jgi:hypothetical protein
VSRAQRLGFLGVAVVIAIVAAIALSSSGGDDEPSSAQTSATPEPTPQQPLLTPGKVAKLRFKQGDTVRFRVRSDAADEVHVHGYDLKQDVEPGKEITFSFPAEISGIFEIELEDAGQQIAQLRVDPR